MYDPAYYNSIAKAWNQASVEEEMHRRAGPAERVRKQWQGDEADLQQVNAMDEASRAIAEIENTKGLTAETLRAGPTAPNMKMTVGLICYIHAMTVTETIGRPHDLPQELNRGINFRPCLLMPILVGRRSRIRLPWYADGFSA